MSTDQILSIIPARGGSKGIPRKNLRVFGGMPLIAHSILQSRVAKSITRTVVSTDDSEIAAVARGFGAEVVMRPEAISGDQASTESALLHVLDFLEAKERYLPDLVVLLQCTSPLRQPGDIDAAIGKLRVENADSLFSSGPINGFVWRLGRQGPHATYDFRQRPRRQDTDPEVIENGSIYVFRPAVLRREGNRLGGKIAVYPMNPLDSFQVDDPSDWHLLESLLPLRRSRLGGSPLMDIDLLVSDFDGVMTDNHVWVGQDGGEHVLCCRGDGLGVSELQRAGVGTVVLSTETNPVVAARCRKLGVECLQGLDTKLEALKALVARRSLTPDRVAYVGNDLNDMECLRWVGWPIAVADAAPEVLAVARMVTCTRGGMGVIREIYGWLKPRSEKRTW